MNSKTKDKLHAWAVSNNWSSRHPSDMERFWDFVIEAYKNGDVAIKGEEFYGFLSSFYQDEDTLIDFYIKYENGIELLREYSQKN